MLYRKGTGKEKFKVFQFPSTFFINNERQNVGNNKREITDTRPENVKKKLTTNIRNPICYNDLSHIIYYYYSDGNVKR